MPAHLPRENLYRSTDGARVRAASGTKRETLVGHFAVFNRWTEIESVFEGQFLEQIAPGAFARTIANERDRMRVLLNHGRDPSFGLKPIASIDVLREDDSGAYYEAPLFNGIDPMVLDGLRANQYGASMKFEILS